MLGKIYSTTTHILLSNGPVSPSTPCSLQDPFRRWQQAPCQRNPCWCGTRDRKKLYVKPLLIKEALKRYIQEKKKPRSFSSCSPPTPHHTQDTKSTPTEKLKTWCPSPLLFVSGKSWIVSITGKVIRGNCRTPLKWVDLGHIYLKCWLPMASVLAAESVSQTNVVAGSVKTPLAGKVHEQEQEPLEPTADFRQHFLDSHWKEAQATDEHFDTGGFHHVLCNLWAAPLLGRDLAPTPQPKPLPVRVTCCTDGH